MNETFFIAGVQFHDYQKALEVIKPGNYLILVRNPENQYDPNAVRIMYGDLFLGFVPKKLSGKVAKAMAKGPVGCRLIEVNHGAKPWNMFLVKIIDYSS